MNGAASFTFVTTGVSSPFVRSGESLQKEGVGKAPLIL